MSPIDKENRPFPLLAKLSQDKPEHWYKHVYNMQRLINNTPPSSTKFTPFRVRTGVEMKVPNRIEMKSLLDEELVKELDEERDEIRQEARENIKRLQEENRKRFDAKRKREKKYSVGKVVE